MTFVLVLIAALLTAQGATGNVPPAAKNWSAPLAGKEVMRDPSKYINTGSADDTESGGSEGSGS